MSHKQRKKHDVQQPAEQQAAGLGTQVMEKAKDVAGSAASMVGQASTTVRDAVQHTTHQVADTSHAMVDAVQDGVRHLGQIGISQDISTMVRNHPLPAMAVSLVLGFCLGRAMSMKA